MLYIMLPVKNYNNMAHAAGLPAIKASLCGERRDGFVIVKNDLTEPEYFKEYRQAHHVLTVKLLPVNCENTGKYTMDEVYTSVVQIKDNRYVVSNEYTKGELFVFCGEHGKPIFGIIEYVDEHWRVNGEYKCYFYPESAWGTFRIVRKLKSDEQYTGNYPL